MRELSEIRAAQAAALGPSHPDALHTGAIIKHVQGYAKWLRISYGYVLGDKLGDWLLRRHPRTHRACAACAAAPLAFLRCFFSGCPLREASLFPDLLDKQKRLSRHFSFLASIMRMVHV